MQRGRNTATWPDKFRATDESEAGGMEWKHREAWEVSLNEEPTRAV